ncbi:MAG: hypothetical protein RSB82_00820 [Victivallaceae bacterium]
MSIDPVKKLFLEGLDEDTARSDVTCKTGPSVSELTKDDVKAFFLANSLGHGPDAIKENFPGPMQMIAQCRDQEKSAPEFRMDDDKISQELQDGIEKLKNELNDFRLQTRNWERTDQVEKERYDAMTLVMGLINEDLSVVARETGQQSIVKKSEEKKEASVFRKVVDWVSTGEEVLNRAMIYLSGKNGEPSDIVDFLKIQYAVQRATQRAELFASIVGTSVSSIKTIMTTQLG